MDDYYCDSKYDAKRRIEFYYSLMDVTSMIQEYERVLVTA